MALHDVSLNDRFDLGKTRVLLSGTQALVRLMILQAARDRARGWHTGGYVSGYRGSPLGAVDRVMQAAAGPLADAGVMFHEGLNEDLAATAIWGAQQAALRGEGRVEGVFGLWYGKGPGVDRSGDALRHVNLAGTAEKGGVLAVGGDDHTGESSTTCHQSELAMIDAGMPVLSPAGVQEILDYGLYGYELSRFSGLWAGMKAVKDTVEATAVVDGRPDRMHFTIPDFEMPPGGLNIRLGDHWVPQEERLVAWKWPAARAFARANGIDKRVFGHAGARIGIVASGKSWQDLCAALELLGILNSTASKMGLTTYKIGQVWPLEEEGLKEWAQGLDLIVVIEEKRKIIEPQIARALFGRPVRLWGERGADGILFPEHGPLDPSMIALTLGDILLAEGMGSEEIAARLEPLRGTPSDAQDLAARLSWFCAGCPHNTSTNVPEGSRAGGGIGCHTMALWMDRGNEGYTHMGAEGANWIGEAPFSKVPHVFQNIGDGTYNHSGLMALRAAVGAGVDMTYKILFNDAVALTGGQKNDGGLTADRVAAEVLAAGASRLAIVHDGKEGVEILDFPKEATLHHRDTLDAVQKDLRDTKGVSVLLYVQTCAAEKRRRRRKGDFPAIAKRVFIDPDVCEGCGDCGVQSNCVALVPVETPLGTKRAVDQSACNADLSCLKGFCPSFVTVQGGKLRKSKAEALVIPDLPEPKEQGIFSTWNIVVTGIGGTGAVTIGAVLAMAAHVEGKGAGLIEMAGLAQKGGAVSIHARLAGRPEAITAIRVSTGQADLVIGGDLVTTAGAKTRALMGPDTRAVVNSAEVETGAFTKGPDFRIPGKALTELLEAQLGPSVTLVDATHLAQSLLGDAIYANMLLTGVAWQQGLIPLKRASVHAAIGLNGASVDLNKQAFELGRWLAHAPEEVTDRTAPDAEPVAQTIDGLIAHLEAHLTRYQNARLARRYRALVDQAPDEDLRRAVAKGYHKLLSYKDEYEVARLLSSTAQKAAQAFEGDLRLTYHLAPPILTGTGPDGRPRKRAFGAWIARLYGPLSRLKVLRGTPLDPFGYTAERRMERALIAAYEADMTAHLPKVTLQTRAALVELAELPLQIRGFGPVKAANAASAAARRDALLQTLTSDEPAPRIAAE